MAQNPTGLLQDVFVGRQPIYGRRLELFAYELLYRGGDVDHAVFKEGDRATSQVLLNTLTEFGLDRVVGDHLAFVNLTRGFVIGEYPLPLPRAQVVLEILEDVPADAEVLEGLRSLRERGFRIALDDFVLEKSREPLLRLTDIVKVDVLHMSAEDIRRSVAELAPYRLKLLAEKIESRAQFQTCLDAGFHYFQGYFLAKPNVLQGTSIPASRVNLLRLLGSLQDPACDIERVQELVAQDVTLSYRLVRHINAAVFGMPRRIESVRETVLYLGLSTVRNLACLFLLANVEDKPHELIVTAMLRARMCQGLAEASGLSDASSYFTVGLFSALDALLDAPMDRILEKLPLAADVQQALLSHGGPLGAALTCVLAYERGDWQQVSFRSLSRASIKRAFLDAVQWVEAIDRELSGLAA